MGGGGQREPTCVNVYTLAVMKPCHACDDARRPQMG